ncbi:hypothetical protein SAMN05421848_0429 [Kushneria avicenniae]|uniref:Uncharacterized protein n=1 Tax=Kushneria avicenniae TaxID=402385 RepID=A0A1I1GAY4_9GAMM|nr:hypothetical protein SAMN05421848_0429 [Kushneria avicenniae]
MDLPAVKVSTFGGISSDDNESAPACWPGVTLRIHAELLPVSLPSRMTRELFTPTDVAGQMASIIAPRRTNQAGRFVDTLKARNRNPHGWPGAPAGR